MAYDDPLGGVRFPFYWDELVALCGKFGYNALPFHFHEVVLAAYFYHAIYKISGIISPHIVKSYNTMSKRTQINWDIHVASQVQAVLILYLALPLFGDETLARDTLSGYTPYAGFVCAMALGYFVWDSIMCLRYVSMFGIGFLMHGLAAGFVFLQGMRPYVMYYAPTFLMFEASTPFLNIHWFSSHLPEGTIPDWIQLINGLCLLVVFFGARIVWGLYQAWLFANDVFRPGRLGIVPWWVPVLILASNMLLNSLNVYWFSKMIRLVRRRLSGASINKNAATAKKSQ
jgi:hypothetical protein